MKRVGALIAAVLLVVVALWVRGRIGGDGIKLGGGEPTGTIVCATEVARACEALAEEHPEIVIRVEAAGTTAQAASGAAGEFDVWLVPQTYAAVAGELSKATTGPAPLGTASKPIAHSRLAFFVHESRATAFNEHCAKTPGWACLLDAAARRSWTSIGGQATWGDIKPFVADPLEASGLLALGGAAAGAIQPPIDGPTIRDDAPFGVALNSLKRARVLTGQPSAGALQRMLAAGPSVADIVVALESERDRFGASAASKATLLYPAPVVSAEIVAVPRRGSDNAERLMDLLTGDAGKEALASTGWTPGAAAAANKNSPSVGSHIVLRQIWEEIR
ncbi:MAG TPA: substrate-binding domain-containing protein [Acidimicrobiales bacterium]|nr:substrate-binding domain-containing protein [Acidimicrobiales bacterium]